VKIYRADVRLIDLLDRKNLFLDVALPINIMQRLADYFLVVGYDHDEERGGRSCGKIIQRFPDKDWPDCPFNPRIIHFCQPQGWILTPKHELPTFFISILTDLDGLRHYCACLTFHQTLLPTTTTNALFNKNNIRSDEADDTAFLLPKTQMYAPKCLVLTSKLDCFEAFRVRDIFWHMKNFFLNIIF
jgi:myotubularin-related protein 5/13